MKYMPGAYEYLQTIRQANYRMGLLVNWPPDEGANDAEKLALLKKFVDPQWVDSRPFDWSIFEAVFFPDMAAHYKPHPYLFIKARELAGPQPGVYQGEEAAEVNAALEQGFIAHLVEFPPDSPDGHFLSIEEVLRRIGNPAALDSYRRSFPIPPAAAPRRDRF